VALDSAKEKPRGNERRKENHMAKSVEATANSNGKRHLRAQTSGLLRSTTAPKLSLCFEAPRYESTCWSQL